MLYMKMMMSYFESLVKLLIAAMFVMAIASGSAFASENADEPATDPAPVVEVVKEAPAAEPVVEVKAEPVAETPAPAAETPAPVVETPAPAADPAPVAETPAPAAEPAAPAAEPAAEVVSEPVAETPAVEAPVAEIPAAEAPAVEPEAAAPAAKEAAAEAATPAAAAATTEAPKAATKTQAAKTTKTAKSETVLKTAEAANYKISGKVLTATDGATITQDIIDAHGIKQVIASGSVRFSSVVIDASKEDSGTSAVVVKDVATLIIEGICKFIGAVNGAGIEVNEGSTLKMYAGAEGASVKAVGNAGYDYKSNAEITAADKAGTYGSASGIGGTSNNKVAGEIIIGQAGDSRLNVSAIAGGRHAAGIGSAGDDSSPITITNVDFGTVHGGCYDAIPEGKATESFKNTLEGGAGIGIGSKGAGDAAITIKDCTGTDIVGGGKSSGIGGATWSHKINIVVEDSTLDVKGGATAPAIGSGHPSKDTQMSVQIKDSIIIATGGVDGAGIGLGSSGSNPGLNPSSVSISGGHIDAYGGYGAAGIGAGARSYNVSVRITNGAVVNAYAGGSYASKYVELYNGSLDLSTGLSGIGQSGAAGIGRGAWGSMNFYDQSTGNKIGTDKNPENIEINVKPSIAISDDCVVSAFADGSTNAISGFVNTDGVESSILLVRFVRNYDLSGNHFLDKSWDNDMILANDGWYYCYLDVSKDTVLYIRDAETLKTLGSVVINAVDDEFANGYVGSNGERIGYYAVAITVPSAGNYKLYTTSDVRNSDDAELSQGSEGYLGGVSYRVNDETRSDIFSVEKGLNVFDWAAFRDEVDPEPEPDPVTPDDPEAPGTTETDPTTPTNPTDDPQNETVVPTPATDPTDPEEETTTDVDPTPADDPAETPVDDPTVNTVTTPNAVTPIVAGGVPLAFAAIPAATPTATAIPDDATPLAPATEAIEDEGTPMGAFDSEDENCWVHWWIMLGMALTALYGAAVAFRRQRNSSNLQKMDDEVMGKEEESVEVAAPTMAPQPAL